MNVLVFVFKFFSYNQTDNPLLSSTVKYITRINIMVQQSPISPLFTPTWWCSPPQAPPVSASLPPPVNSHIHKQTNRGVRKCKWWWRATLCNHEVTLEDEIKAEGEESVRLTYKLVLNINN